MSPAYWIEQDFCEDCQGDAVEDAVTMEARIHAAKKRGKQCLMMESRTADPFEAVTLCLDCLERRVTYLRDGINLLQSETKP